MIRKKEKNPGNSELEKSRLDALRENMVKTQIAGRAVTDKKVLDAMKNVPREDFVTEDMIFSAYEDRPLSIGYGQTISQPYIVALMTECLQLTGNEKVLEIGTGSGYQTAILAEIAKKVYSVELVKPLYLRAKKTLEDYNNVFLANADGYEGWEEFSPYDRIILTAAPEDIPEPLIEQLKEGGIMVLPSGPSGWSQSLLKIKKIKGKIKTIKICDVAFVPLVRKK